MEQFLLNYENDILAKEAVSVKVHVAPPKVSKTRQTPAVGTASNQSPMHRRKKAASVSPDRLKFYERLRKMRSYDPDPCIPRFPLEESLSPEDSRQMKHSPVLSKVESDEFYQRQQLSLVRKEQHIAQKRQELQDVAERECTFEPAVVCTSPRSPQLQTTTERQWLIRSQYKKAFYLAGNKLKLIRRNGQSLSLKIADVAAEMLPAEVPTPSAHASDNLGDLEYVILPEVRLKDSAPRHTRLPSQIYVGIHAPYSQRSSTMSVAPQRNGKINRLRFQPHDIARSLQYQRCLDIIVWGCVPGASFEVCIACMVDLMDGKAYYIPVPSPSPMVLRRAPQPQLRTAYKQKEDLHSSQSALPLAMLQLLIHDWIGEVLLIEVEDILFEAVCETEEMLELDSKPPQESVPEEVIALCHGNVMEEVVQEECDSIMEEELYNAIHDNESKHEGTPSMQRAMSLEEIASMEDAPYPVITDSPERATTNHPPEVPVAADETGDRTISGVDETNLPAPVDTGKTVEAMISDDEPSIGVPSPAQDSLPNGESESITSDEQEHESGDEVRKAAIEKSQVLEKEALDSDNPEAKASGQGEVEMDKPTGEIAIAAEESLLVAETTVEPSLVELPMVKEADGPEENENYDSMELQQVDIAPSEMPDEARSIAETPMEVEGDAREDEPRPRPRPLPVSKESPPALVSEPSERGPEQAELSTASTVSHVADDPMQVQDSLPLEPLCAHSLAEEPEVGWEEHPAIVQNASDDIVVEKGEEETPETPTSSERQASTSSLSSPKPKKKKNKKNKKK